MSKPSRQCSGPHKTDVLDDAVFLVVGLHQGGSCWPWDCVLGRTGEVDDVEMDSATAKQLREKTSIAKERMRIATNQHNENEFHFQK